MKGLNATLKRLLYSPSSYFFLFRIGLGSLFVISGLTKLLDLSSFAQAVEKFELVPLAVVPYFTVALPLIEYALGIMLIFGLYPRIASFAAFGLLVLFTIAIISNLAKGKVSSCGCFGAFLKTQIGYPMLWRNLILLVISFTLLLNRRQVLCLGEHFLVSSFPPRKRSMLVALGVVLFAVSYIAILTTSGLTGKISPIRLTPDTVYLSKARYQTGAIFSNMYHYGDHLPSFQARDISGRVFRSEELKGSFTIFSIAPIVSASGLDVALVSANKLASAYRPWNVNVILILRIPGEEIDERYWPEIQEKCRRKATVPVFIDWQEELSRILRLPDCLCPITLITDRQNIFRLALISGPEYIIEDTIERYVLGGT